MAQRRRPPATDAVDRAHVSLHPPRDVYGPGPIILGPTNDGTRRTMVRFNDQPGVHFLTHTEICALPIRPQWFAGSRTGLITSWATRDHAESYALESTTLLGRITIVSADVIGELVHHRERKRAGLSRTTPLDRTIVILTDPHGTPLRGQP